MTEQMNTDFSSRGGKVRPFTPGVATKKTVADRKTECLKKCEEHKTQSLAFYDKCKTNCNAITENTPKHTAQWNPMIPHVARQSGTANKVD
jgi:hypothetical protein